MPNFTSAWVQDVVFNLRYRPLENRGPNPAHIGALGKIIREAFSVDKATSLEIVDVAQAATAKLRVSAAQFGVFNALLHAHPNLPFRSVRMNRVRLAPMRSNSDFDLTT